MGTTTSLMPVTDKALDLLAMPALPAIAEIRQNMQWMKEFRKLLLEYVEEQMDPALHMYTFAGNAYTRVESKATITEMLAKGQKPALNQDGIHNLMALYNCDIDDQQVEEIREDGHYTCRVTLWLRYFGGRRLVGYGSSTTRESKYAYRWVYESDVPKGVDKSALKSRTYPTRDGRREYVKYRLDNEELADVEATVLQIAFKRAKSSGVKALPCVSEMFSKVGDPDEEERETDAARQEVLTSLRSWLQRLKAPVQLRAIQVVFGEPLRANDIPKLTYEQLAVAWQVVQIGQRAEIKWDSPTLGADLKAARAKSAVQAKADLFGDDMPMPTGQEGPVEVDPETGEIVPPPDAKQSDLWKQEEAQDYGEN